MDDLYEDLENYNDVNALDELRNENKHLKFKLEEYAASMEKLQKNILQDFDRLSSEHKKLEINFSSLIKTARAEIERKTQIISNLNAEKDKLVLDSLQHSNRSLLNIKRNMTRDRDRSSSIKKVISDVKGKPKEDLKKCELERESNANRMPSVDTFSSANTDESSKLTHVDSKTAKMDLRADKNVESKENVKEKSRSATLRNRRKSMPVNSKQYVKFSSDEEENDSASESLKKDWHPREDRNRKMDRSHADKQIHKVSETSGIDEKYSSYHESSRETYYSNKPLRYNDKYRNPRDKYEGSSRYRRHFSPDRRKREYPEDPYNRPEYRNRVLESPPPDRLSDLRRNRASDRERRPNYDKNNVYNDRSRFRHERNPMKHKIQDDCGEPASKKIRSNPSNAFEVDRRVPKEVPLAEEKAQRPLEDIQHESCQSPDYNVDVISTQPVREIMNTAATPLEDPRLTSNKYVTKTHNNKITISTAVGRDVGLKCMNRSSWTIPHMKVLGPLQYPPRYNKEFEELYMDLNNPVSNMSLESGEVQSDTGEAPVVSTELIYDLEYGNDAVMNPEPEVRESKQSEAVRDDESRNSSKYKIPKLKKVDESKDIKSSEVVSPLGMMIKELEPSTEDCKKSAVSKRSLSKLVDNFDKIPATESASPQTKYRRTVSTREILAGDLELSDETSDNFDAQKFNTKIETKAEIENLEKDKNTHFSHKKDLETNNKYNIDIKKQKTDVLSNNNNGKGQVSETTEQSHQEIKKQKSKRKSPKSKIDSCIDFSKSKVSESVDKKGKLKKKESKPVNKKAKFTDLFGDSSSLITPEDIGLVMTQTEPSISKNKYVPIFEDAQDANDFRIAENTKDNAEKIPQPTNMEVEKEYDLTKSKDDDSEDDCSKLKEVSVIVHKESELGSDAKSNELPSEVDVKNISNYHLKSISTKALVGIENPSMSKGQINNGKQSKENKKKKSKKDSVSDGINKKNIETAVYKNLYPETVKEPDVVATVIMSTGVQPTSIGTAEVDVQLLKNAIDYADPNEEIGSVPRKESIPTTQALATSTPHKSTEINVQVDERIPKPCTNESGNEITPKYNQTNSNLQSDIESDVPDVRIFVRRRRKIGIGRRVT